MKTTRSVLAIAALLIGIMAAGQASAQYRRHHYDGGPRVSIGLGFGFGVPFAAYPYYAPFYAPFYYPAYYPAPVVVQQQSPVYIEQDPQPSAQPSAPAGYWYYCAASGAYYPYVKDCPAGWQRVAPQPG